MSISKYEFAVTALVAVLLVSGFVLLDSLDVQTDLVLGNSSSKGFVNVSATNWTHTVSGTDRLLIVGISYSSSLSQTVSAVTFGAVNLTKYTSFKQASVTAELWYLLSPAQTTDTISITFSGSTSGGAGATSWNGVDQTSPLGVVAITGGNSTNPSVVVTSATGETVQDILAWDRTGEVSTTATVNPSQSQQWNINSARTGGAASTEAGAPNVSMDWTLSQAKNWTLIGVGIRPSVPDTTPPVISNVNAGNINSNSATITWNTDEVSDSQVEYGLDTNYGNLTLLNPALVTNHSQILSGLTPNTIYHYRVKSRDAAGNLAVSGDNTFTTLPAGSVPNIVVIMADDLGNSTLLDGINNGWMPNLKSLIIDQGLTFANSFVVDSLCCPSRATFLTGQHTHNHGVLNNDYSKGGGVTKLNDTSTLATWLKSAGYRNGLVGKYLNGYADNLNPSSPTDDPTYIPPGWDDWRVTFSPNMYNYDMNYNGVITHYGSNVTDYQTDQVASHARDFISDSNDNNDAQPFFLWVATRAPHPSGTQCPVNHKAVGLQIPAQRHVGIAVNLPLPNPPSFNESNVTDKPAWLKNNYSLLTAAHINCLKKSHQGRVEEMMAVDDLIGTVINELQATGELGNTVIMFTSDNGFSEGEHRVSLKSNAYEEAIRVPLYVKGPGIIAPQTATQMVLNTDLASTILELAQTTAGLVQDGRSFVPILQNPGYSPWRNYFLIEHDAAGGVIPTYSAIRSNQHKWVEYSGGNRELYDFGTDPNEMTSQHNNPSYDSIKNLLKQKLLMLKTCSGGTCWQ